MPAFPVLLDEPELMTEDELNGADAGRPELLRVLRQR